MKEIHIVANSFKGTADKENILTYDSVLNLVKRKKLDNVTLYIEQGINEESIMLLRQYLKKYGKNEVDVKTYFDGEVRCNKELTHKHKQKNISISEPKRVGEELYESLLMLDEHCAELSDHVTGKHLQFMLLVEAARQMVNAVTEKYYSNSAMVYLANDLNIKFNSFTYPLKTVLRYKVVEKKVKSEGNGRVTASIEFVQGSNVTCSLEFKFTILNRSFVTGIENSGLSKCIAV